MVNTIKRLLYGSFYALLAYMPLHVFLSQSLSSLTGGLSVWKAAKDALTLWLASLAVIVVWYQRKRTRLFDRLVLLTVAYGLLHLVVWGLNPDIYAPTAVLGSVYNNRLLWYLLIGLGAALLWAKQLNQSKVIRLVLLVSTVVCLLGVVQYFLLSFTNWDVLSHFGYSLERGARPAFFIDDKPDLPRIMSTLRDPNSLGAFLILPITLLTYKFFYSPRARRMLVLGLLGLHGLALLLTFSRSAWAGLAISLSVFAAYNLRSQLKRWLSRYWPVLAVSLLLLGGLTLALRDQYTVQNIIAHSDENTTAQFDSNEFHLEYARRGMRAIADQPLGYGPGTAGLVSIQNPDGGFLTENYYLQIGYEVGVLGLVLFITSLVVVYRALLRRRSPLALALIASFWGYAFINLLLHTWSNEAVAAQWWLLCGVVIGSPLIKSKKA